VNVEQIGDVLVIKLPTRLDAAGLSVIERDFSETVAAHKGKVLADMSDVNIQNLRRPRRGAGGIRCLKHLICKHVLAK